MSKKIYFLTLFIFVLLSFISCNKNEEKRFDYLFKTLSEKQTNITFRNDLTEDENHSIINYIYFYNGGGVSAGDVNNDGLPDLFFTSNQNENKLYINKGNLTFEDVTEKANISKTSDWNTGTTMVDINGDGLLDIYICAVSELLGFKGHNELYINNGDGTFTEKAAAYGLDFKGYSTQAYFFDYDKDNDLDAYIVNHAIHTSLSHGKASQRNTRAPLVGDVLLQNNNGKFEDVSENAGIFGGVNGYGLSAAIADYNNDGWDDIYVCNDFHEDDYYYINNKNGTFTEQLAESFATISRFSMGSDAADINGDGFQDIITLDMLPNNEKILKETEGDDAMLNMQTNLKNLGYKDQFSRNMLQINNKGDYFYENALFNGIADTDWSWSPLFADYNNDGHLDVFVSNGILRRPNGLDFKKYVSSTFKKYGEKEGLNWLYKSINEMPDGKVANQIFKGNSKKFDEKTGIWMNNDPTLSNGAIYVDLDLDGDLDLVTNNVNDFATIYENTSSKSKNYVQIKLEYIEKNKEGIGSKVIIYTNQKKDIKQLHKSRGFLSSITSKLHFGLDTISKIDSIEVYWPNHTVQKIYNPTINKTLTISYSNEATLYSFKEKEKEEVFKKENLIRYKHVEDSYNDFFNEKLIPYKVSTLGPAFAIGDVDKNGFDDVFIGGSSGKKAEIYLNNGYSFVKSSQKNLDDDAEFEDNHASFFDVDNDGDLDLYVASGIHAKRNKNYEFDRLYLNNKGTFSRAEKRTIYNPLNTGTVIASDYDSDRDTDLFIGNVSNPSNYGEFVASAFLENNGKGVLNASPKFLLKSKVTQAVWTDVNNDNLPDLLIATEWDSPKIFINNNGDFTETKIPANLNGLWQSITAFDIDNDGDKDIVLGNWGENNKFQKYMQNPLLLYYGDFDNNDKKESIIAYNINGKYYPLNSKDELSSQMNIISKRFTNHATFAMQPIENVLTVEALQKAEKREIHLLSSGYLENNNGAFDVFKKLDDVFQLAPINHFLEIEMNDKKHLLISGNSEKPSSYHGAFNSFKGYFLQDSNNYHPVSDFGIDAFHTQIKQTAVVKMKNKNVLFVLANNDSLKTYTFKN